MNWSVTLTPEAHTRLRALAQTEGVDARLRVSIEGGGCSGFRYRFVFDEATLDDDVEVHFDEGGRVTLVTDPVSLLYLQDAVMDYVETLHGAEFRMHNPGVRRTCGCGQSFDM